MVGEGDDVGAANEGVPAADQIRSVWRQTPSKIQKHCDGRMCLDVTFFPWRSFASFNIVRFAKMQKYTADLDYALRLCRSVIVWHIFVILKCTSTIVLGVGVVKCLI